MSLRYVRAAAVASLQAQRQDVARLIHDRRRRVWCDGCGERIVHGSEFAVTFTPGSGRRVWHAECRPSGTVCVGRG